MNINAFSVAGGALALTCFLLTTILFVYGNLRIHRVWALFNFVVSLWGVGAYFIGQSTDPVNALNLWRVVHVAIAFIPVLNFHVVFLLCGLELRKTLLFFYFQATVFAVLSIFYSEFIGGVRFVFDSFYYDVPGWSFYPFFFLWTLVVGYSHFLLFLVFRKAKSSLRNQILYFFVGTTLGFSGGITNFLPALGFDLYPFGNFTIPIYSIVVTYAILRYRILDISVAITRTGIFVAVYSIVLGIPFALAFGLRDALFARIGESWWIVPLVSSTVLATVGPFIYLYIQRRAEDRLFQEQKRYQTTLRQASLGMGRIKDLRKLVSLIVHIVSRTVRLEYSAIYLFDPSDKVYRLVANRSSEGYGPVEVTLRMESEIVKTFLDSRDPLVCEEIKHQSEDYADSRLAALSQEMSKMNAEVAVPSYVEDHLVGILVLGRKKSGKQYSADDLGMFSIVANQAALAIENAQFYEEMKQTHAQLLKTEKMATIGTMADGLSHQINNRLHSLGFIAGDMLDTVRLKKTTQASGEFQDVLVEMEGGLQKILENVKRGGEIVEGLLKYTRKGEQGFEAVHLDKLLDAAIEMAQFKIKVNQISIVRNYPSSTPAVKGNFTQLQEVFFNLIDNAYDAMMQRKSENGTPNYHPVLTIDAMQKGNNLFITVQDNGIGVRDDDQQKLFTPFFTTKFSTTKKGTGLGLYVMKKLIEDNHRGKIIFSSEFLKGTRFVIQLPVQA